MSTGAIKIRHVDYSPDEYIAGVGGLLTPHEQAVYWMVCSLILSHGGAIPDDPARLAHLCCMRRSHVKAVLDALVGRGKLQRNDHQLDNKRASNEVQRAVKRMRTAHQNGIKGGRPLSDINDIDNPAGCSSPNLSLTTNHQLSRGDTGVSPPQRAVAPAVGPARDTGFAAFWAAYPERVGKAAAVTSWARALKRAEADVIMAGLARYIAAKPADRNWCHAATWLNQQRWLDEYATTALPGIIHGRAHHDPRTGESANARAARRVLDRLADQGDDQGDDGAADGGHRGAARPLLGRDHG